MWAPCDEIDHVFESSQESGFLCCLTFFFCFFVKFGKLIHIFKSTVQAGQNGLLATHLLPEM